MNRKWFAATLIVLSVVLLTARGAVAQDPEPPDPEVEITLEPETTYPLLPPELPQDEQAVAATLNSRISYQGVLKESGMPVTGSRDMVFRLYSDNGCTTLVQTINKSGVGVANGLFNVTLDVTHSNFNGQGMWVRVAVGGVTVISCQEVLPAPYALSLRPGAEVSDTSSRVRLNRYWSTGGPFYFTSKYGIQSEVTGGSYTFAMGLYGSASSGILNYGVYGTTTDGYGVYGTGSSDTSVGVYGYTGASGGTAYGLYGSSQSTGGAGVYAAGADGYADLMLNGIDGRIRSDPTLASSDIELITNDYVAIRLDSDNSGEDADFFVFNAAGDMILDVDNNGTTIVDVLHITGGADLAEPFEIAEADTVQPGMVVAIDPAHPGQLRIADRAYDRTVAGCVSGANGVNPGLTMYQENTGADGSFPVALSGRVYCWADASSGPIEPGDLLTTSATPGHLMRVSDYALAQGAIVGKSMSALPEGRGLILVLVSLQ